MFGAKRPNNMKCALGLVLTNSRTCFPAGTVAGMSKVKSVAVTVRSLTGGVVAFATNGFPATTIEDIAQGAGVAVQTFYATFGSKRGLLTALLERMEEDADLPSYMAELERYKDEPCTLLRRTAEFNVTFFDRAADILRAFRQAASSDPVVAELAEHGDGHRRTGQAPAVHHLYSAGLLRSTLTESEAADILWALTSPESFDLFVDRLGWPPDAYATWLGESLCQLLLA